MANTVDKERVGKSREDMSLTCLELQFRQDPDG